MYYYDLLNIIACVAVVVLHQNGGTYWTFSDTKAWNWSILIETLFFWAVPIFFMLTGATLIGFEDRYNLQAYFKKRIFRTFVPFILFSLFAGVCFHKITASASWSDVLINLLDAQMLNIYWFFIPLFYLYLLMPAISKIRFWDKSLIEYTIVVLVFLNALPLINSLCNYDFRYSHNDMFGPVMYAVMGYYFSRYFVGRKFKIIVSILAITCFVIRAVSIYCLSHSASETSRLLTNYYYPTIIFPAIAIFVLMKDVNISQGLGKYLRNLSSLSLGVYLLHYFVIIAEGHLITTSGNPIMVTLLLACLTYLICISLVYTIKKIPIIRLLIP